jgi:hypothetical protein
VSVEAPRYLCGECGHTRADHSLDLEFCRGVVLKPAAGSLVETVEECDCRGWRSVRVDVPAGIPVGQVMRGHEFGGGA